MILHLFKFVVFFGQVFLAQLLHQVVVLIGEKVQLADRALDMVLGADEVRFSLNDLDLQ